MSEDAVPERPPRVPKHLWDMIFPPDRSAILKIAARYFVQGFDQEESFEKALIDADNVAFMSGRTLKAYSVLGPLMGCNTKYLPFPHVRAACEAVGNTAQAFWSDIVKSDRPERLSFQRRLWWRPEGACLICGYAVSLNDRAKGLKFSRIDGEQDFIHESCAESLKIVGKSFGSLVYEESLVIQGQYEARQDAARTNLACIASEDEEDDGYWSNDAGM